MALAALTTASLIIISSQVNAGGASERMAEARHLCVVAHGIGNVEVYGVWEEDGIWYVEYANPPSQSAVTTTISLNIREMGAPGMKPGWIRVHWYNC
ncbi:hypothetical protein [Xanthobacter sp. R2A-8]|nr:hypothetical protein [Xanthobacter sp. R2A-8]